MSAILVFGSNDDLPLFAKRYGAHVLARRNGQVVLSGASFADIAPLAELTGGEAVEVPEADVERVLEPIEDYFLVNVHEGKGAAFNSGEPKKVPLFAATALTKAEALASINVVAKWRWQVVTKRAMDILVEPRRMQR